MCSLPIQGTNIRLETVEDIMAWREQRKKKWLSKIAAAVCVPLENDTDYRRVQFGDGRGLKKVRLGRQGNANRSRWRRRSSRKNQTWIHPV
jgi:hypothetical protein